MTPDHKPTTAGERLRRVAYLRNFSPASITRRLRRVSALRDTCVRLAGARRKRQP